MENNKVYVELGALKAQIDMHYDMAEDMEDFYERLLHYLAYDAETYGHEI